METIAKLKSKRAALANAAEAAHKKLLTQDIEDADLILTYEGIKEQIAALDQKIGDHNRARAKLAVPVYDPTDVPRRQPRRCYSLKSFKDKTDARGVTVRGDEQAFGFGKFIQAAVFSSAIATEWCTSHGIPVNKAQSEATGASGAVLVPDQWLQTIINLKEQFGCAARECGKVVMTSDTVHMPRRTGGLSAFFVAEGGAPTKSTATFDEVVLSAKKMAALVRISTELAEDSMISIADWIVGEIAYAFASKEDDCLFVGDGTSTYGGMVGLKNAFATNTAGVYTATGHTSFDALTTKDITLWRGYLPAYARAGAKFFVSQSFFNQCFQGLGAAGGGNTLTTLANGMAYSYLGTPIVISQKLPKQADTLTGNIVAYYGNMQKAVAFGERRQMTLKRSDERYFDTDQIGIMGTERLDIVAHDVGTSSVIGPLVALKMG